MSADSDLICLRGLHASTVIGVYNWERQVRQTVVLDLELATDIKQSAATDSIEDTLDYKQVAKELIAFIESSRFMLLETMAEKSSELILQRFPVRWLRMKICKQWALRQVQDVSIVITRSID